MHSHMVDKCERHMWMLNTHLRHPGSNSAVSTAGVSKAAVLSELSVTEIYNHFAQNYCEETSERYSDT